MAAELNNQYNKIMHDLHAKKIAPIYILHGEETYFIDSICNYIEHNLLTESEKGFNQTVFYAKDVEPNQVIEAAKRFPMMAEKQVIIVKEAQGFKKLDDFEKYNYERLNELNFDKWDKILKPSIVYLIINNLLK